MKAQAKDFPDPAQMLFPAQASTISRLLTSGS
jgi:hypothetical protein